MRPHEETLLVSIVRLTALHHLSEVSERFLTFLATARARYPNINARLAREATYRGSVAPPDNL